MIKNQILNHNCFNRAEVHDEGPTPGTKIVNPEHYQTAIKQSGITSMICSDLVIET